MRLVLRFTPVGIHAMRGALAPRLDHPAQRTAARTVHSAAPFAVRPTEGTAHGAAMHSAPAASHPRHTPLSTARANALATLATRLPGDRPLCACVSHAESGVFLHCPDFLRATDIALAAPCLVCAPYMASGCTRMFPVRWYLYATRLCSITSVRPHPRHVCCSRIRSAQCRGRAGARCGDPHQVHAELRRRGHMRGRPLHGDHGRRAHWHTMR